MTLSALANGYILGWSVARGRPGRLMPK